MSCTDCCDNYFYAKYTSLISVENLHKLGDKKEQPFKGQKTNNLDRWLFENFVSLIVTVNTWTETFRKAELGLKNKFLA